MRRYNIVITDKNGDPFIKSFPDGAGTYQFNGSWASANESGTVTNPGALNVELDIPVSVYNAPMGGAALKIYGIGLPMVRGATDFNPSIDFADYFNITISAGMAKGLPLAKPGQYGEILRGRILQAYGNWQGTSQTLDFIIGLPTGNRAAPLNLQFECKKDESIKTAIENTLAVAFSGIVNKKDISVNVSPNLVPPETITNRSHTLTEFSTWINQVSKSILKDVNYPGVQIAFQNGYIDVYDYSDVADREAQQLEFTDFIGLPTWIGVQTITFKTVMRGDLRVGNVILMPKKSQEQGLILSAPGSYAQYRNTSAFTGKFWITNMRHTGIFRQGSADSWVTTFQAISLLPFKA